MVHLIKLQEVDLRILALDKAKEQSPESLRKAEEALESKKKEYEQLIEELEELQLKRRKFEDELEQEYLRLKKSQTRLMEVKAQREYQALLKEIEEIKKANKQREEELLQMMERIENLNQEKEKLAQEIQELEKVVAEERAKYENQRAELDKKRAEIWKERETLASKIPSTLLKRYEFVKSRRNGVAVVPVIDAVCAGCNMNIPPQLYNELIRDDRVYECPICQRIIFYRKEYESVLPSDEKNDENKEG
jgi:predicted  nucleic acid-binding Zn-ribbon protein